MTKLQIVALVLLLFGTGLVVGGYAGYAIAPRPDPVVCSAPRLRDHVGIERALFVDLHERLLTYPGMAFNEGYVQWDCYVLFIARGHPGVPAIAGVYEFLVYVYRWDGENFVFLEAENNPYRMATVVPAPAADLGERPLIR